MTAEIIDLRSDTVTQPCQGMRRAMAEAIVGDDVIGHDPTVDRLQEETAELLGKEAAIFMPSGTMTNQIALRTHCKPGDEFLCDENCHIYNYEQGAFAQLSGLVARTILGEAGVLNVEQLHDKVRPRNEHMVRTRLLSLENTHNRGAGRVYPYETLVAATGWARSAGLATHLDGARLFNAVVATGIEARDWARHFDSVSVCFSKGLGAPVGSALAGSRDFIHEARWHRKAFGGGMRQAGILAAGALYALEHNVTRLAEDHAHARQLARAIEAIDGLKLLFPPVETNIVIFEVRIPKIDANRFQAELEAAGLRCFAVSPRRVRLVTHLNVSRVEIDRACEILATVADAMSRMPASQLSPAH